MSAVPFVSLPYWVSSDRFILLASVSDGLASVGGERVRDVVKCIVDVAGQ